MRRASERELLPVAPRITGIVCQMLHTSRGQRFKVARRVSESDDVELRRLQCLDTDYSEHYWLSVWLFGWCDGRKRGMLTSCEACERLCDLEVKTHRSSSGAHR